MFKDRTRVLDGSIGTLLQAQGYKVDGDPLWSARVLSTDPRGIKEIYKSYMEVGVEVLTTATYQASTQGLQQHMGLSVGESEELIQRSVSLTREAIKEVKDAGGGEGREVLIAGSVGPYGASQADLSEFTGDYMNTVLAEELVAWHRPRVAALVGAGVDLLLFETIPALGEALALVELLREFPGTMACLSFYCKDAKQTGFGDPFGAALKQCQERGRGQLAAVGMNCTAPWHITPLLEDARAHLPPQGIIPRVVYPNSGETYMEGKGWSGKTTPWPYLDEVRVWCGLGAGLVGGCCRLWPEDLREIARVVRESPTVGTKESFNTSLS